MDKDSERIKEICRSFNSSVLESVQNIYKNENNIVFYSVIMNLMNSLTTALASNHKFSDKKEFLCNVDIILNQLKEFIDKGFDTMDYIKVSKND